MGASAWTSSTLEVGRSSVKARAAQEAGARAVPGLGLAADAFEGGAGGGVEAARHASGEEGLTTSEDRVLHGLGHQDGIARLGECGVHQDGVEAELHCE